MSLCTPWRHMGGVDVWLHMLTLALERDCGQLRVQPAVPPPSTDSHCVIRWIGSRASPDASEQRKISYYCRELNHVACSTVTIPTELSGTPSDGVNRVSWDVVTQCPAPHRTTALWSESVTEVTLSTEVLTDTNSVTCSTLYQQDDLVPVRGDATRPLFAKRDFCISPTKDWTNSYFKGLTTHSFPNTVQFYEHQWLRCSSTADTNLPLHSWQQCRHYFANIHGLFPLTFDISLYRVFNLKVDR
jgi:hypothetical protein